MERRHANLFLGVKLGTWITFLGLLGCKSSHSGTHEATSLLGEPLDRPTFSVEEEVRLGSALEAAHRRLEDSPEEEDALVWYGRRLAYLGRYREAIDVFSRGLELHPTSVRLLRHRGHRYITVREFELAIADLAKAAALCEGSEPTVEQDGAPNPAGIPIGTTQGNVYYHLGLAHYLMGEFEPALAAYDQRAAIDRNDDNRCATAYWRYLILRRLGRADEALAAIDGIHGDMELLENHTYHGLVLLYRGLWSEEDLAPAESDGVHGEGILNATLGYGLSMHRFLAGETEAAEAMWRELTRGADRSWSAFGAIAAEAELARIAP